MNRLINFSRRASLLALGGALLLTGGCDAVDELLSAENPERILERDLNDERLVDVLAQSVVGEFQRMYADPFIWRGSMFTDEQITGINWEATARLSQRVVRFDEGDPDLMFSRLSASRAMADSVAGRLRTLLDDPQQNALMARTLAYAGYNYVLLAEAMCEATVDMSGKIHSTAELFQLAIPRFEEAIEVAQAAGRQDIANLARVGLSRAHLNLGNDAEVMRHASQVPLDFVWWVEYSGASPQQENVFFNRVTGANHSLGMHPNFLNGTFGEQNIVATQTDPRIQHTPSWSFGHNRLTKLYKPFQPLSYSGFTGETIATGEQPPLFEKDTDIKMASGLEALHHYYEAAGPSGSGPAGSTLDFVNARRAFGNQQPVNLSGDALMAELREQRGRDLFLGGFRLGDLRRWKAQGVGDFFPKGGHPVAEWGQYGEATCYPIPLEEYESNPKLSKPKG